MIRRLEGGRRRRPRENFPPGGRNSPEISKKRTCQEIQFEIFELQQRQLVLQRELAEILKTVRDDEGAWREEEEGKGKRKPKGEGKSSESDSQGRGERREVEGDSGAEKEEKQVAEEEGEGTDETAGSKEDEKEGARRKEEEEEEEEGEGEKGRRRRRRIERRRAKDLLVRVLLQTQLLQSLKKQIQEAIAEVGLPPREEGGKRVGGMGWGEDLEGFEEEGEGEGRERFGLVEKGLRAEEGKGKEEEGQVRKEEGEAEGGEEEEESKRLEWRIDAKKKQTKKLKKEASGLLKTALRYKADLCILKVFFFASPPSPLPSPPPSFSLHSPLFSLLFLLLAFHQISNSRTHTYFFFRENCTNSDRT
jgi:hypothetical protein